MVKVRAALDLGMDLRQAQRTLQRLEAVLDWIVADERREARESRAAVRDIERRYGVRSSGVPSPTNHCQQRSERQLPPTNLLK
jgi:hypothetical protein